LKKSQDIGKTNRVAWRDKSEDNQAAWKEAMEGIDKGYPISTIARWLMKEKNCPLSIHTLRHQLKETHEQLR
jgi:hypothetical protein